MTRSATVLFIDPSVRHPDLLVAGLDPETSVHRLPYRGDALAEIASVASGLAPVGRIAILAHGDPGSISLSGRVIDRSVLESGTEDLARLQSALAPGADVILMSCSTGAGLKGLAFVAGLEAALGVPVRASETDLGGDAGWSGIRLAATIFAPTALASYPDRLATVNGDGGANNLTGTNADDTISGNGGNDTITGLDGNDLIGGGTGNELAYGGAGNDSLYMNNGSDTLYGDDGDDTISTGAGDDTLYGGNGNDFLITSSDNDEVYGGSGDDRIASRPGNDRVFGEDGNDSITGDAGADYLNGGAGDDLIIGGDDTDTLDGGAGNDTLSSGAGADTLSGGAGNDLFEGSVSDLNGDTVSDLAAGDQIQLDGVTGLTSANVRISGGNLEIDTNATTFASSEVTMSLSNNPTLDFSVGTSGGNTVITFATPAPANSGGSSSGGSSSPLTVTNQTTGDAAGTETGRTLVNNSGASATGDLVSNTGNGNTVLVTLPKGISLTNSGTASAQVNTVAGATLTGRIQAVEPDVGVQSFLNGHGQTFMSNMAGMSLDVRSIAFTGRSASAETVTLTGTTSSSSGSEAFVIDTTNLPAGSALSLNNVEFAAIVGNATVNGGAGRNYVVGDDAAQFISLGAEDDTLAGGGGNDTVGSAWGEDILYGNQGMDLVFGGGGMDTLYGGQDADTVRGDNDNDVLYGNKGSDTLSGGQNEDLLYGGQNEDIVYGNAGNDSLHGNLGNDTLYGGQGSDLLWGSSGDDYIAGNAGDDTLSGGAGADTFVFSSGGGNETVTDFVAGTDTLALEAGLGVSGGTEIGGNAVVTFSDGGTVTLIGVHQAEVAAATGWEL
ncbi:DUF4347 domain-containing protein [Nisaea sediminum]|uniref:DUF4347 domain-containing protein n=1 Tax=Nisaea sediminum TaxID=2775867 RepID=UPI001868576A|nr:DUF4347 domain-containing protein [Nisaea sediminum]